MGVLITPGYLDQQRELHGNELYGTSGGRWSPTVSQIAHMFGCTEILDYGCGKGTLKANLGGIVREYDPSIPGKDHDPEPADMVVCTDVLEHIEPDLLDDVLQHLASKVRKVLFFSVSSRPAKKTLPDGRNAHLIIQPREWWLERMRKYLTITETDADPGEEFYGVAMKPGVVAPPRGVRPNKQRRKLSTHQKKKFEKFFESLREGSRRYSDPIYAINSFEFWEGVDDKPADCLMVVDILEHQWDVHAALVDIKKHAKRAALICVRLDFRGVDYWREMIGQHFMITEVVEGGGRVSFVANTKTLIPGAKIVAAGTDESRWDNISESTLKYTDGVSPSPPHERRAIIGCYGPSLSQTWDRLKEEAQDGNADVVSVSGCHDFLLDRGIVPRFHIECDPRPHKADNIKCGNPDTEYLLSSTCHPKLFERIKEGKIRLWHSSDGEVARRIRDDLKSEAPIICGGGSVGLRALAVMFFMGYRKLSIYGMDCSFSDDGSEKWAGPHAQKENQKEFSQIQVLYNGRLFTTTGILLSYGTDFFDMMSRMMEFDPSIELKVYGDGLLQARIAGPPTPIQILLPENEAA